MLTASIAIAQPAKNLGISPLGNPILAQSAPAKPGTPTIHNAKDILAGYRKSKKKARAAYEGRPLAIYGDIKERRIDKKAYVSLLLKGNTKRVLTAFIEHQSTRNAKAIDISQSVALRGDEVKHAGKGVIALGCSL